MWQASQQRDWLSYIQVSFIIDQLEAVQEAGVGHPFAGKPIVILADKDKEEMDTLVRNAIQS